MHTTDFCFKKITISINFHHKQIMFEFINVVIVYVWETYEHYLTNGLKSQGPNT